jgi:hypothetical protein
MNLLEVLMQSNGGQNVNALAERFGLSGDQAQGVLGQLLPALTQGMQNNISQPGGLESLLGALSDGHHTQYIDDPSTIGMPQTVQEGNGILGHLLGSKDASRALAQHVSGNTGVSDSIIKQLLPVVASMAMGALAKNQMSKGAAASSAQPAEGLMGMLDFDRDGSAVDDVIGLMGKFFGR